MLQHVPSCGSSCSGADGVDGSGAWSASVISACVVLPARTGTTSWPCKHGLS